MRQNTNGTRSTDPSQNCFSFSVFSLLFLPFLFFRFLFLSFVAFFVLLFWVLLFFVSFLLFSGVHPLDMSLVFFRCRVIRDGIPQVVSTVPLRTDTTVLMCTSYFVPDRFLPPRPSLSSLFCEKINITKMLNVDSKQEFILQMSRCLS